MADRLERSFSAVLTFVALAIGVSVVYKTFFTRQPVGVAAIGGPPVFVSDWKEALPISIPLVGDTNSPVRIVVLTDFECPACRAFHGVVNQYIAKRPQGTAVLYVFNPLGYHRFALAAARGGDCAARTGAFRRWADVMFDKQDSLGLKPWTSYAADAHIADTSALATCAASSVIFPRIQVGLAFGARIHLIGTPTVLINGWEFSGVPSLEDLERAADQLEAGKHP